jgi:hypothetical protein
VTVQNPGSQIGLVSSHGKEDKMKVKSLSMLVIPLLMTGLNLNAGQLVQVTLEGTSGVSNGTDLVLPYELSINGQNILADCYDFFDTVTIGESWMANIETLAEAATSGKFSGDPGALHGYELIGVLSTLALFGPQSQIDIQEDMWNVFDPAKLAATPGMASDLAIANAEIPTFDFSRVEFIEPLQGESVQPFVTSSAPEPASCLLFGIGLAALGSLKRRGHGGH